MRPADTTLNASDDRSRRALQPARRPPSPSPRPFSPSPSPSPSVESRPELVEAYPEVVPRPGPCVAELPLNCAASCAYAAAFVAACTPRCLAPSNACTASTDSFRPCRGGFPLLAVAEPASPAIRRRRRACAPGRLLCFFDAPALPLPVSAHAVPRNLYGLCAAPRNASTYFRLWPSSARMVTAPTSASPATRRRRLRVSAILSSDD